MEARRRPGHADRRARGGAVTGAKPLGVADYLASPERAVDLLNKVIASGGDLAAIRQAVGIGRGAGAGRAREEAIAPGLPNECRATVRARPAPDQPPPSEAQRREGWGQQKPMETRRGTSETHMTTAKPMATCVPDFIDPPPPPMGFADPGLLQKWIGFRADMDQFDASLTSPSRSGLDRRHAGSEGRSRQGNQNAHERQQTSTEGKLNVDHISPPERRWPGGRHPTGASPDTFLPPSSARPPPPKPAHTGGSR